MRKILVSLAISIVVISLLITFGLFANYVQYCNEYTVIEVKIDDVPYLCNTYTEGFDLDGKPTYLRIYDKGKEFIVNLDSDSVVEITKIKEPVLFTEWVREKKDEDNL